MLMVFEPCTQYRVTPSFLKGGGILTEILPKKLETSAIGDLGNQEIMDPPL